MFEDLIIRRKINGRTYERRIKAANCFHRNMKVVPRSQRRLGINCNKNGCALDASELVPASMGKFFKGKKA